MDQNGSRTHHAGMQHATEEDDESLLLLRQTQYPLFGPEFPHPSEHLLLDGRSDNTDLDALLHQHISHLLASYSVDINHGFLPRTDPLRQLPLDGKFGCWEIIVQDLSQYLYAKIVRSVILSRLTVVKIEQDDLLDEREFQRALFVLAMLSHAFVWGETPVSDYIPACLAIPWVELSKRACCPPIITHSLTALSNWRRFDIEKPIELGNLAMLNGFLSGVDEANFYLVTIELEYRGAKALEHMLKAQYFASQRKVKELTEEFRSIEAIQKTILATLSKMFTEVDPYIFYNRVRHFLAGWKGNASLPNGMLYEGVSETRQFLHGASAGQSSLIAAFDVFFDVKHQSEQTSGFMSEMRHYMPIKHRRFLEVLGAPHYNVSRIVKELTAVNKEEPAMKLLAAYNSCIDQLVAFRNKHIQIVTLFILMQMRKSGDHTSATKQKNGEQENNEEPSAARGTGGTILMPFLKACRDETKVQRLS